MDSQTQTMTVFRLIFEMSYQQSALDAAARYFKTVLMINAPTIQRILYHPPRIIMVDESYQILEHHKTNLERMGNRLTIEPALKYPALSFTIAESAEKILKKELSKTCRVKMESVIFLLEIESAVPEFQPPSMMGNIRDQIEACFRDSDTVIRIDDQRIVILCFATGYRGGSVVVHIIRKTVNDLLGDKVNIAVGYAVFPEHGVNVVDLLITADQKKRQLQCEEDQNQLKQELQQKAGAVQELFTEHLFINAHGKLFERLIALDTDILISGLAKFSAAEQFEFLSRIPFDSPHIAALEETINHHGLQPAPEAQHRLEIVLQELEFDYYIRNMETIQQDVLTQLDQFYDLPMMPAIAAKIFAIINHPESPVDTLVEVIEGDLLLKSKLLRIVNSAFYGSMKKINTVKQAVMLLGMEKIMDLAFGLAVANIFDIKIQNPAIAPRKIWNHSVITALIVQFFSKNLPHYNTLGGFTAGLLHDVGKLFFMQKFPSQYLQIFQHISEKSPAFELEEERFGINHAAVGKYLLERWGMPEMITEAVAFHHNPHRSAIHHDLAAIIGLADYLYYQEFHTNTSNIGYKPRPRLSYSHYLYLNNFFPDITEEGLKNMGLMIRESITADYELINVLGRDIKYESA